MKQLLSPANAVFSATSKTIAFSGTIPATISHILHVTNVKTGTIMYQPQGGLALSGSFTSPVLTLNCSTVGMADSDALEIFYDDGIHSANAPTTVAVTGTFYQATQPISGTVTANTGLSQPVTDAQLRATPVQVVTTIGTAIGATLVSSQALEANHVLKSSAGTLISLIGYNSKTSTQFIQLFNTTAVPGDSAIPVLSIVVPATSNFSVDVPICGLPFTTGICVSNSSTAPVKTAGTTDCFFTAVVI